MNPIPLASPDGTIWAYACSYCRHVRAGSSLLAWEPGEGPHERLIKHQKQDAERCCRCRQCRQPIEECHWQHESECAPCKAYSGFTAMWNTFALCLREGLTTRRELDQWWTSAWRDDDDE